VATPKVDSTTLITETPRPKRPQIYTVPYIMSAIFKCLLVVVMLDVLKKTAVLVLESPGLG